MAAAAALLLTPPEAPAQETPGRGPSAPHCTAAAATAGYIAHPKWAAVPSGDDVGRYYPLRSDLRPGCAILDCRILPTLHLGDCTVLVALPPEEGYDAAALKLSRFFVLQRSNAHRPRAAGRRVRIPIRWALAPELTNPVR